MKWYVPKLICRSYNCERNEDGYCREDGYIEISSDTHQCESYYPKYVPVEEEESR